LKAISGKVFGKILETKGWRLARIQESHHIYIKPERNERISVPIHKNQSLKIGLQKNLMKIADIKEEDI